VEPEDRRRRIAEGELDVLERIARGEDLHEILDRIVTLIENVTDGTMGSVLLVDTTTQTVRHGAAPHLPPAFTDAIDGAPIGPEEGSCGAAAYLKRRIVVSDIATHPYWKVYKALALPLGLRACWSSPILDRHGDILGTFAIYYGEPREPTNAEYVCVDVATHLASIAIEKDRADARLRESELRFRQIYEAVEDVIFHVVREDGGRFMFTAVNPSFTKATGIPASAVVGKYVDEIIPPESRELVLGCYRRAIEERTTVKWEETSVYPTGTRHGDVTITPIFDSAGVLIHLVGTVHDVTPHKLAEQRIAAQAALLDLARDSIIVLGPDDYIRYWNGGAERLYGIPAETAVGARFFELIHSDDATRDNFHARLDRYDVCSAEVRRRTASGSEKIVDSSATLIRDVAGTPAEVLLIESDITERRALEAQFLRAQRVESLGTLAGGVAHDFNNILTGILAHVRAANRSLSPDHKATRFLGEIEKASWRAAELTRRILTFGRRVDSSRVLLDLHSPVGEAFALLRATVPPPAVIDMAFDEDVPMVLADSTAVHQIVMNLGTNAARALGTRPGHITVALRNVLVDAPRATQVGSLSRGRYAMLEVRDTGSGITEETREKMFEPYFTTSVSTGTGLGLSVVHGIVISHEGAIEVETELGVGTTIRVYFPAAEVKYDDARATARIGRTVG